jgi:hypothetical protein
MDPGYKDLLCLLDLATQPFPFTERDPLQSHSQFACQTTLPLYRPICSLFYYLASLFL